MIRVSQLGRIRGTMNRTEAWLREDRECRSRHSLIIKWMWVSIEERGILGQGSIT